jgi:TRAP-type C4-dicarboxylate transport system permease small subunit
MHTLERLSRSLNRWVEYLLFGLGFSMAFIVAVQVFFRYVLNHSLFWSEELARYLLIWLTFLGASAAYWRGVHPGVDIVSRHLPRGAGRAAALIAHGAALTLFGVMIVYGIQFAYFVRLQISPALNLPKWTVYSVVPLSGLILLVHGLTRTAARLKGTGRDR